MVARVTRLVAEKFVLSTFPRALTTLSSMCSRAVRALESSPGLIMMMDRYYNGRAGWSLDILLCRRGPALGGRTEGIGRTKGIVTWGQIRRGDGFLEGRRVADNGESWAAYVRSGAIRLGVVVQSSEREDLSVERCCYGSGRENGFAVSAEAKSYMAARQSDAWISHTYRRYGGSRSDAVRRVVTLPGKSGRVDHLASADLRACNCSNSIGLT